MNWFWVFGISTGMFLVWVYTIAVVYRAGLIKGFRDGGDYVLGEWKKFEE